ncbi:nucleotidyltransferase family protein [Rhodococcus xishaensis]|uniref:Nucleotidyltransferase family protein n=1 Tax=Rhodococcus xishaensis TaxID=2487364 RepID=A0A3S3E4Z8_9NOCA|nr:nucleotidyltransferase family protein [Rhodococcus xishaensis]RVW05472.1 nucleotidyltransferase family protein [Rhodococcus xishaensis]
MFVTGLVLAAGRSRRLGRPKQLLPYRGATLLDATLRTARACRFHQLLVTVPGAAEAIEDIVDLRGCTVVHTPDSGSGCSASVKAALPEVDPLAAGIVLLLGDQPGVQPWTVRDLVSRGAMENIGMCRYTDGLGHPLWLGRSVFGELAMLRGDKAVWGLFDRHPDDAFEIPVDDRIPLDVDTWDEYRALLDQDQDAS